MAYKDKDKEKKAVQRYRHTPKGKATTMWYNIVERAQDKRGNNPTYQHIKLLMTRDEFISWVIPQLEQWKHPLVGTKNSPSIDRINTTGHYELSNLQLLTKSEHCKKKTRIESPTGTSWCIGCKQHIPIEHFARDNKRVSGVKPRCKFCRNKWCKVNGLTFYINPKKDLTNYMWYVNLIKELEVM